MSVPAFHPAVVLDQLSFIWPDGAIALDHVSGVFSRGRTGLVGRNGSGKSTLLRILLDELAPTSGRVQLSGEVAGLDQFVHHGTDATLADLLGVGSIVRALTAIEHGSTEPADFDAVGSSWGIHERTAAELADVNLDDLELTRPVDQLSGGEVTLAALLGLRRRRAAITLLDEPTNNLDREARRHVQGLITSWPGTLIVVSHDVALLDLMENIAELHDHQLTTFGGPYTQWREHVTAQQEAAEQALRTAEQKLKAEQRQQQSINTRLAHRAKLGARAAREKRVPKIILNTRAFQAENSAAKVRATTENRIEEAQRSADAAAAAVRDDRAIHIVLPDPELSPRRRIVDFESDGRTLTIRGPERVALVGRNGVGKTRLLAQLMGQEGASSIASHTYTDRIGYLDQQLIFTNESANALEEVRRSCPSAPPEQVRAQLARFGLREPSVTRPIGNLSGGERFRVALARLLLAEPAHELLLADEPTNHLDLDSIDALVEALSMSKSALIIVSHDEEFLDRLGPDRLLELRPTGLVELPDGIPAPDQG